MAADIAQPVAPALGKFTKVSGLKYSPEQKGPKGWDHHELHGSHQTGALIERTGGPSPRGQHGQAIKGLKNTASLNETPRAVMTLQLLATARDTLKSLRMSVKRLCGSNLKLITVKAQGEDVQNHPD
jgi:hypothetical protein